MRRYTPLLTALVAILCFLSACDTGPEEPDQQLPSPRPVADSAYTVTDTGLKYYDFQVGTGDTASVGDSVHVHYTGWLTTGQIFDSSVLAQRPPIGFTLGKGKTIPGFEEGIVGMRVGGYRQLVIPPDLAYGTKGGGPIPPNATLIFEVQLVKLIPDTTAASSNP